MNIRSTTGKHRIVLGVTGSIAAYKSAELAREFIKRGHEVKVIMTDSAAKFISALTMQAVTGNPVATSLWEEESGNGIGHIQLADWAEVIVVAPATADFIAKMAYGFSESSLLATILASKAPLVVAPAMNVNMLTNSKTVRNIKALADSGAVIVEPEEGALACGWNGSGRLAEINEIALHVEKALSKKDMLGKHVVVTAGPTREALDPVRFLTNRSSGKMGAALACEAFKRGADVTLIHGPIEAPVPRAIKQIPISSASELYDRVIDTSDPNGSPADIVVMAAAVSDFRPANFSDEKIKKGTNLQSIPLKENPDILAALAKRRGAEKTPKLVGFAVETVRREELLPEVFRKLKSKGIDLMVGNLADDAFDKDTNKVLIVNHNGECVAEIDTQLKTEIAKRIFDQIAKL
jgi:phosphopantothenoylcysteine decarboxylase/phosphopantothenate--cysteine ligase